MCRFLFISIIYCLFLHSPLSANSNEFNNILINSNVSEKKIKVNPHVRNPLSAIISFNTEKKVSVSIRVIGQDGDSSDIFNHFKELKQEHSIPVLGLYPDYTNLVEVTTYNKKGKKLDSEIVRIQTRALRPKYDKKVEIIENNIKITDNSLYLDATSRVAFDKFGKIRWVFETPDEKIQIFRKTLDGKNLVCLHGYKPARVLVVSLLGEIIEEYPFNSLGRHDVREMPSGNFLVAISDRGPGVEDRVIEIDRKTKETVKEWNYRALLDTTRAHPFGKKQALDWMHINCVFYDEVDNSIIVSGRHQHAVVKIDAETSEIKWILGPHHNWPADLKKYLLEPKNFGQAEFNWGQHAPLVLPNRNVMLFNNGNYRSNKRDAKETTYSNAVEYKIDEEKMSVELVWQYGKEREIFTKARGDVDYFPETGNRLISFMSQSPTKETPLLVELDKKDKVLFEAVFDRDVKHYRFEKLFLYE